MCRLALVLLATTFGSLGEAWVSPLPAAGRKEAPVLRSFDSSSLFVAEDSLPSVPVVVLAAGALFLAAQGWINNLAGGDSGLGAYLRDGRGYQGSDFKLNQADRAVSSDPLPWLKLPQLDFVEVAGQETTSDSVLEQLDALRDELVAAQQANDRERVQAIAKELEQAMEENGLDFNPDQQ